MFGGKINEIQDIKKTNKQTNCGIMEVQTTRINGIKDIWAK